MNYQDFLLTEAPASIYYVPDFLSAPEEAALLRSVDAAPRPKWTTLSNRRLQNWGGLPHPKGMVAEPIPDWLRLYCDKISDLGVFRVEGEEGSEKERRANHVLVNEYLSGQGILPHEDGPLYFPTVTTLSLGSHTFLDFYGKQKKDDDDDDDDAGDDELDRCLLGSILVQPRSLLIVKGSAYTDHLHGIAERPVDRITERTFNLREARRASGTRDYADDDDDVKPKKINENRKWAEIEIGDEIKRGRRVSLTIRRVPKVLKAKISFGKTK